MTNDGTITLGADETINSLISTGTLEGTDYTLTASTYVLNDGSTIIANLGEGIMTTEGAVALHGSSDAATVNINSGTLTLGSSQRINNNAAVTVTGSLILNGNETIDSLNGSGTVSLETGSLTLGRGEFTGVLEGAGSSSSLIKNTTGILVLSGNNTYTGITQINEGEITLSGSLASPTITIAQGSTLTDSSGGLASTATVTNSGTLALGAEETISSLTNSGTISGSYTLAASTYSLTDGAAVYSNLGTGILNTNGDVALYGECAASTITVAENSNLHLWGEQLLLSSAAVNLNGSLTLEGGDQTISTLNGSGTVYANIYKFIVSGGGDFNGQIKASGTQVTSSGGALNLIDNEIEIDEIQVSSGASFNLNKSRTATNTVTVLEDSTLALANESSLDNAGDVIVQNGANLTIEGGSNFITEGNITVEGSGTLDLDGDSTLSAAHIITDANSVITVANSEKLSYTTLGGSGTVDTGTNTFTNTATVTGFINFTGEGDAVFVNKGTVHPGNSPGLQQYNMSYIEQGTLHIDIGGTTPITEYGQVRVNGTYSIDPDSDTLLDLRSYGGFVPQYGQRFQIIGDSDGNSMELIGTYKNVIVDDTPSAALVLDMSTGKLIATGLNFATDTYKDLGGSNDNSRAAANALFSVAQVGRAQIRTATTVGQLAGQILNGNDTPLNNLAHYTPDYYGGMAELAFMGDRALIRNVWNKLSPFANRATDAKAHMSAFVGQMHSSARGADAVGLKRNDFFAGSDFTNGENFSLGATVSGITGQMDAALGKSKAQGGAALGYMRIGFAHDFTALLSGAYSHQTHQISRTTLNGIASGSTQTHTYTGSLGLQYRGFDLGRVKLSPRTQLVYSHAYVGAFNEEGTIDALHNDGYSADLVTGELGFSAIYPTTFFKRSLNLEFLSGVERVIASDKTNMNLNVISIPTINYPMGFAKRKKTRYNFGLNLAYNLFERTYLDFSYETTSGGRLDHKVQIDLRVDL